MGELNKGNIVDKMLEAIPEVMPLYKEELSWWDEILPHIVFGDVLNRYVINLLIVNKEISIIKRIFNFYEEMALSSDLYIRQILTTTVLERLGDEKKILNTAKKYMGLQTIECLKETNKALGRMQI